MSPNYSSNDILSMQQDAIRRVKEMQRISQERVAATAPPEPPPPPPPIQEERKAVQEERSARRADNHNSPPAVIEKNSTHFMDSFSNIIAGLNLDSEKILLLALIIVLLNEGADTTLILALCYLLI